MFKRPTGIKPTHLWHLTSKKDFLAFVNQRITARENLEVRDKKDMLQMCAIVFGSALGVAYSLGHFCTERKPTTVIKSQPPPPSAPSAKSKCVKPKTLPCPPEEKKAK